MKLPEVFRELTKLQELDMQDTKLDEIPEGFYVLPERFGNLTALEKLDNSVRHRSHDSTKS